MRFKLFVLSAALLSLVCSETVRAQSTAIDRACFPANTVSRRSEALKISKENSYKSAVSARDNSQSRNTVRINQLTAQVGYLGQVRDRCNQNVNFTKANCDIAMVRFNSVSAVAIRYARNPPPPPSCSKIDYAANTQLCTTRFDTQVALIERAKVRIAEQFQLTVTRVAAADQARNQANATAVQAAANLAACVAAHPF